jgi:hydroxysqualene synthase
VQNGFECVYEQCESPGVSHYENFPVASYFLPKRLRQPIALIYTFARKADDWADEGVHTPEERLVRLNQFWAELQKIEDDLPSTEPLFIALKHIIKTHRLPIALFFDLLTAFKQDVTQKTHQAMDSVLEYCQRSANPIGRLLLHLTEHVSDENVKASDALCTALQLINFLQDIQADSIVRGRCYLPQDELLALGISLQDIQEAKKSEHLNLFLKKQLLFIEELLKISAVLNKNIGGLFGFELCMIRASAEIIFEKLCTRKNAYTRPVIRFWHGPFILGKAIYWYVRGAVAKL